MHGECESAGQRVRCVCLRKEAPRWQSLVLIPLCENCRAAPIREGDVGEIVRSTPSVKAKEPTPALAASFVRE